MRFRICAQLVERQPAGTATMIQVPTFELTDMLDVVQAHVVAQIIIDPSDEYDLHIDAMEI